MENKHEMDIIRSIIQDSIIQKKNIQIISKSVNIITNVNQTDDDEFDETNYIIITNSIMNHTTNFLEELKKLSVNNYITTMK